MRSEANFTGAVKSFYDVWVNSFKKALRVKGRPAPEIDLIENFSWAS
jgi:hypothetical protein